jgi:hypothetical protein
MLRKVRRAGLVFAWLFVGCGLASAAGSLGRGFALGVPLGLATALLLYLVGPAGPTLRRRFLLPSHPLIRTVLAFLILYAFAVLMAAAGAAGR